MIQILRYFLFPFSLIYKSITSFRNLLFDLKFLPVFSPEKPTIGIGNLTIGGTGKTPVVAYLIDILEAYKIVVISRGYGRKSKGFMRITKDSNADLVGDEPLMLFNTNPGASFFVSENRVEGYKKALELERTTQLFLFDDVFQHRYIKTKINLLLCDYNRPFFKDFVLPMGLLREGRAGAKRASVLLVTKCPENISESDKEVYVNAIRPYTKPETQIFFANFISEFPKNNFGETLKNDSKIVLLSGLANNNGFRKNQNFKILKHFSFQDHYAYRRKDLNQIFIEFPEIPIVTTEKDFVKIKALITLEEEKYFYVVIQKVKIIDEEKFKLRIFDMLNSTISN